MKERPAREVTLLESLESGAAAHESWTDADRAWADRAARESWRAPSGGGPRAALEAFAAERARHALHRFADREPRLVRALLPAGDGGWRGGVVAVVLVVAFALGVAADAVGSGRHVNLLAPPFWGVLLWNLAVYVAALAWPLLRSRARPSSGAGPVTAWAAGWAARQPRASWAARGPLVQDFVRRWSARTRGLSAHRGRALLHAGAAALALGLIAGLYARGLVLDYRAVWESTLLDAGHAHALVGHVFAPASALTGIALPDAAAFAAMRVEAGADGGAPAAPWLHLMAATLALGVVLPRGVLAFWSAAAAGWRARRIALPLEHAYYARLAALATGTAARVSVHPYAAEPAPAATLALRALAMTAFEPVERYAVAPTVPFGDDEATLAVEPGTTQLLALFELAATPEDEHHGRFLARLDAARPPAAVLRLVVDASGFDARFAGMPERLAERRVAWHRMAARSALPIAVVHLASEAPLASDVAALQAAAAPAGAAPAGSTP